MRRRRIVGRLPSESSSDEDQPLSKIIKTKRQDLKPSNDDSSSESDIETYLQKPDKIDLNSPFFNLEAEKAPSFNKIEQEIFSGVARLTSESEESNNDAETNEASEPIPSTSKLNFSQLHEYTKKIEEAKRTVEEYNSRKAAKNKEINVEALLAAGESNLSQEAKAVIEGCLHSSDFESCSDSEKEGWEEVEDKKDKEKNEMPKEGLQITVDMPGAVKKKKGVDLLAAIKRRINRVKKEHQVLIHKVHVLCWIAHGNFVSSVINSETVLSVALSLLPSQHCYPADRTDLGYLEQILKWYRNTVVTVDKPVPSNKSLEELLKTQINKKEAYNQKMLVYIFVAIMRSLGIQCRLVLSFQVEPLRPPNSELHSLSTKTDVKKKERPSEELKKKNKSHSQSVGAASGEKTVDSKLKAEDSKATDRSKRSSEIAKSNKTSQLKVGDENTKTRSKSAEKLSKRKSDENKDKAVESKKTAIKDKGKDSNKGSKLGDDNKNRLAISSKDRGDGNKDSKDSSLKVDDKNAKTRSKSAEISSKRKSEEKKDKIVENKNTRSKSTSEVAKAKILKKDAPQVKIKLKECKTAKPITAEKKKIETRKTRSQTIPQVDGADDTTTSKPNLKKLKKKEPPCPVKTHPKRLKTVKKYRDSESEDDFTRSPFSKKNTDSPKMNAANLKKLQKHIPKALDVRNDVVNLVKKSIKEQKDITKSKTVKKRKSAPESDEDSDYLPEVSKKKHYESDDEFAAKIKVKKRVPMKKDLDQDGIGKKKQGLDIWVEVFLETEEKWISVDVIKGQVHCVNELYTRATHPVAYVIAWNNDNTVKDVTRRYCTNFNTTTRKLRVDSKWWDQTLQPFLGRKTPRDKEEDDELERQQLEKPLPTSISEYKNHPLYVLKRHLLKFEALYPPDAPTLGFVKNEPVYSRQCVYVLHSRELWLKQARVVKPGEQPYKIVKARPKWDKLSNSMVTDQMLEIFGIWQTQEYEPPTAENGVVPRNAFGNVELFKACMLPKKTVHLKLPGLNKIARRMNIDCAAALVGFDFHGGWNHPVYDGYVVCEEFEDVLVAAWELEQEEIEKKEQEKLDKRVYGNWKKLIKGLLIRERLKAKYDFSEPSGSGGKGKNKPKGGPKLVTRKRKIESDSE